MECVSTGGTGGRELFLACRGMRKLLCGASSCATDVLVRNVPLLMCIRTGMKACFVRSITNSDVTNIRRMRSVTYTVLARGPFGGSHLEG